MGRTLLGYHRRHPFSDHCQKLLSKTKLQTLTLVSFAVFILLPFVLNSLVFFDIFRESAKDNYENAMLESSQTIKCTSGFYPDLYDHMAHGGELFIKPGHIKYRLAIFNEIERQI